MADDVPMADAPADAASWQSLSNDEVAHILGFLPLRQRLITMGVSKATYAAGSTTPALWQRLMLGKVDERFYDDALSKMIRWAGPSLTHVEVLGAPSITSLPIFLARRLRCQLQFLDMRSCAAVDLSGLSLYEPSVPTSHQSRPDIPSRAFPRLNTLRLAGSAHIDVFWGQPHWARPRRTAPCSRCRDGESCVTCVGYDFSMCSGCHGEAAPWRECSAPNCMQMLCEDCHEMVCDTCEKGFCEHHFDAGQEQAMVTTCDLCDKTLCSSCAFEDDHYFETCSKCDVTKCKRCVDDQQSEGHYSAMCSKCYQTTCGECQGEDGNFPNFCNKCYQTTCNDCASNSHMFCTVCCMMTCSDCASDFHFGHCCYQGICQECIGKGKQCCARMYSLP